VLKWQERGEGRGNKGEGDAGHIDRHGEEDAVEPTPSTLQSLKSAESAGAVPEGSELWEAQTGAHTEVGSSTSGRLEFFDTSTTTSRAPSTTGTDSAGATGPPASSGNSASATATASVSARALENGPASGPASTADSSSTQSEESSKPKAHGTPVQKRLGRGFLDFLVRASMSTSTRGSLSPGSRPAAPGEQEALPTGLMAVTPHQLPCKQATTAEAGGADRAKEHALEAILRSASAAAE